MQLNDIIKIKDYEEALNFALTNGYTLDEIGCDVDGNRQFKIAEKPQPTEEDKIWHLRSRRELECFSVINRGQLWYNTLNETQIRQLDEWYKAWLDVTKTKVIPEKPYWLN